MAHSVRIAEATPPAQVEGAPSNSEPHQLALLAQPSEQDAWPDGRLLKEIIDHLPISLTVQDDTGRFILANAMATANLAIPAEILTGASPADFLSEHEAASRREWEQDVIRKGKTVTVEGSDSNQNGERTWLTSHKPVRIFDRSLLISSSIDITEHKQIERELLERAHIDELTGLPDRILSSNTSRRSFALRTAGAVSRSHLSISTTLSISMTTIAARSVTPCW